MMDDKQRGLYEKYTLKRKDGRDAPGEKHEGCRYFVLDVTHDPFAIPALIAYKNACATDYPALAIDLHEIIQSQLGARSMNELFAWMYGAFVAAEEETAAHFDGQTCSMRNKKGTHECPICHFTKRLKYHLMN